MPISWLSFGSDEVEDCLTIHDTTVKFIGLAREPWQTKAARSEDKAKKKAKNDEPAVSSRPTVKKDGHMFRVFQRKAQGNRCT